MGGVPTWSVSFEGVALRARFQGHLDAAEGARAADAFAERLAEATPPVAVIFDVREMSGYDSGARKAWQERLWPLRKRIASIRLRGGVGTTEGATFRIHFYSWQVI